MRLRKIFKFFYFLRKGRLLYIWTKFSCFARLWISKNVVLLPPTTLMMEPTNHCNLKCPLCPTGLGTLNRPKRTMKLEEFKIIIDQVKGYIQEIILWNYGEPFINKEILPMVEYASARKINIITSTNGHFFHSPEYCEKIVASGLHRMIVAVDGATQEAYEKFRRNGDLNKVIEGIKMLVAAKKKTKSKTPYIELQFIIMKHNEHQKEAMAKLAKDLEVDVFIEKDVGIHASDEGMFASRNQYMPSYAKDRFRETKEGKPEVIGEIPNDCDWPYRYAVVNADGNIVPCCLDIRSEHVMGNLFKDDFMTIWRNKNYQNFRKQIRTDRKKIKMCSVCTEGVRFKKTTDKTALIEEPTKEPVQTAA